MRTEPKRLGVREARATFPSIIDAAADGQRYVVTLYGKDRCAIVPMADFEQLTRLAAGRRTAKPVGGRRG